MKIHEHQAKEILARYDLPIPKGKVAHTPEEARAIAEELGGQVVVKAQVHVGGRGKAGGVKLAQSPAEAEEVARQILGMEIKGIPVKKVLVTEAVEIAEEYYLGLTLDRDARMLVMMLSASGGVDIEEVARETPEKIAKVWIDPLEGLHPYQLRELIYTAPGVNQQKVGKIAEIASKLYQCYLDYDCNLVEINPLVVTGEGELVCVDAKIDFDDNGLFRHPELEEYREVGADLDEYEKYAHEQGVTYVHMPEKQRGRVGIIGNGAGLVMTTLDVVARAGEPPNNFLDVGGGSRADMIVKALDVVLRDPEVKAVFVNIFGGISRCDEVAKGLVEGVKSLRREVPIVVRMTGTNEELGRQILSEQGGDRFITASTMEEGARKVVEIVHQMEAESTA